MNDILDILSKYSDALIVFFTAVVTLSTVVYAVLTWILVSETRKMREAQTEPKLHITIDSFEFAINIMRLNIKNIGLGPASNVQFTPSVMSGGESADKLLSEFTASNFFTTGLRHFGPGQNIYSTYTDTTKDFEGKAASVLSFKLTYESATKTMHTEEIILDMSEIKGRYQLGKPPLYSIANNLEKIQKDLGHIISGFKHLKTDVYSSEDRRQAKAESEERRANFKKNHNDKNKPTDEPDAT